MAELSPERGWRPRLSLRKKSFSLDTPETAQSQEKEMGKSGGFSSAERI